MNRNFYRKYNFSWIAAAAAVALCLGAAAAVQAADGVASASISSSGLSFSPNVAHNGGRITVSGTGVDVVQPFGPGERPSFQPVDNNGDALPDGNYTYEIVFYPRSVIGSDDGTNGRDEDTVDRVSRSRSGEISRGLSRILSAAMKMSGSFSVRFGSIVDPETPEAE